MSQLMTAHADIPDNEPSAAILDATTFDRFQVARPTVYLDRPLASLLDRRSLLLSPQMRLVDALQELRDAGVRAALVLAEGFLVGIFEESVGVQAVRKAGDDFGRRRVASALSPVGNVLSPHDTIAYALRKLHTAGARALAVVEDDGEPLGLIDADDLIDWVGDQFPTTGT